jgi:hypothetical protein
MTSAPVAAHVVLPGDRPPWTPSGLWVERGDRVTVLGSGHISWSRTHDVGAGAKFHLWGRVPGGRIFGCTQDTTTVVADRTGPLELCVYLGSWADATGSLATGHRPYRRGRGSLGATVLRWPAGTDPVDGLAALAPGTADPRLVAGERERLLDPVVPPPGWSHLPALGPTDIFRHGVVDGRPAVEVVCDDDAGILVRDCRLALDAATTIEWSWRVDELPGTGPEDRDWAHDHLGIAAEFGSGHHLTWFWSTALNPLTAAFTCPRQAPAPRPTLVPVRSGSAGLGRWHREARNVWTDHERFVGLPPARVVQVRLIAVSHFGRRTGRAVFSDIVLRNHRDRVQVL